MHRPRSSYPIFDLFGLFFRSEQCFSLITIQPEQYFSASFSQDSDQAQHISAWPLSWKLTNPPFSFAASISSKRLLVLLEFVVHVHKVNIVLTWYKFAPHRINCFIPLCLFVTTHEERDRHWQTSVKFEFGESELGWSVRMQSRLLLLNMPFPCHACDWL